LLEESRAHVGRIARPPQVSLSQIAGDFEISESCLHRSVKSAVIGEGMREKFTTCERAEFREVKKRNRLSERENYVLRRARPYLGQHVPPE